MEKENLAFNEANNDLFENTNGQDGYFINIGPSEDKPHPTKKLYTIIPAELRSELWRLKFEKQYKELQDTLEHIIPQCIDDFEFYLLAGISCRELERYKDSMRYFQKALAIEANSYLANFEIAKLFVKTDLYELAEKTFSVCSELEPDKIDPLIHRSIVLYDLKKFMAAKQLLFKAISIDPRSRLAYDRLVMCHIELAEFQEAQDTIHYMISHKIGKDRKFKQLCHANLLTTKCELGDFDEIETSIKEVENFIQLGGENLLETAEPRFNLATTYLRLGQTQKGWDHYYYRFDQTDFPTKVRQYFKPRVVNISEIRNKTILIWREQGVGDEIMIYGLVEKFRQLTGANIILETDPRLVDVVARSNPHVTVRSATNEGTIQYEIHEDFDLHMPLADILVFLGVDVTSLEGLAPWLNVDQQKVSSWKKQIKSDALRIGFACQSHLKTPKREKQSNMDFDFFEPLIQNSPHTWVNLDYNLTKENQDYLSQTVNEKIFFPNVDLKHDFNEVSSILRACDILVSPYMALRSLAGAVGTRSASFVRGTPYHFDLGASLKTSKVFSSPLTPNSRVIQFWDSIDDAEFNIQLLNFLEKEIKTVHDRLSTQ